MGVRITFTGTITTTGGSGSVSYYWMDQNGYKDYGPASVLIRQSGSTYVSYSRTFNISSVTNAARKLWVTSPNPAESNWANYTNLYR